MYVAAVFFDILAERYCYLALCIRSGCWYLYGTVRFLYAVLQDFIAENKIVEIEEVIPVAESNLVLSGQFCRDVLVYFLHFDQLRCHFAVGCHDSVAAEVIVVRCVAEAPSEIKPVLGFSLLVESLVYPVPDASSDHPVGFVFYIIPVFFKVSDGISHSMCIFAEEIWLAVRLLVHIGHILYGRIHIGIHIRDFIHSFIMDEPSVDGFRGCVCSTEIVASSAFISQ